MGSNLEYSIELSGEGEHSWVIQEVDGSGTPVGDKVAPWAGNILFELRGIRYTTLVETNFRNAANSAGASSAPLTSSEVWTRRITGKLKPEQHIAYSMLGTSREVKRMDFTIMPRSCSKPESPGISIVGEVSYTDRLELTICVGDEAFNSFVEQIYSGPVKGELLIGGASGFYSSWVGSDYTDELKILVQKSKAVYERPVQVVSRKGPQELESIDPPRLGFVSDFTLAIGFGFPVRRKPADSQR